MCVGGCSYTFMVRHGALYAKISDGPAVLGFPLVPNHPASGAECSHYSIFTRLYTFTVGPFIPLLLPHIFRSLRTHHMASRINLPS